MRDRLIEILKQIDFDYCEECAACFEDGYATPPSLEEFFADMLLAEGVIVPPCKVGDKLYNKDSLIDDCCYWEIAKFEIYADESGIVDDSDNWYSFEDIGRTVFLTREEAEKALERREDDNH